MIYFSKLYTFASCFSTCFLYSSFFCYRAVIWWELVDFSSTFDSIILSLSVIWLSNDSIFIFCSTIVFSLSLLSYSNFVLCPFNSSNDLMCFSISLLFVLASNVACLSLPYKTDSFSWLFSYFTFSYYKYFSHLLSFSYRPCFISLDSFSYFLFNVYSTYIFSRISSAFTFFSSIVYSSELCSLTFLYCFNSISILVISSFLVFSTPSKYEILLFKLAFSFSDLSNLSDKYSLICSSFPSLHFRLK